MADTPTLADVSDEETQWDTGMATAIIAVFGVIAVLFVVLIVACVNMVHNEGLRTDDVPHVHMNAHRISVAAQRHGAHSSTFDLNYG